MPHRAGLDRKAVVQAAAQLIDTVGVEQLTLAQLAEHLGIRIPSLYNHIAGLAGLRRDLALYCTQELLSRFSRVAIGKSQDEAIIAIADAYRAFAKDHPGCYSFTIGPADLGDLELHAVGQEVVDVIQRVLAGYGLHNEDALHAVRGLRSIVHGFVSLEMAGGFGLTLDLDESFHRLVGVFIDGLRSKPGE